MSLLVGPQSTLLETLRELLVATPICFGGQGFDDGVNTVWNPGPGHPEGMLAVIKRFYHEEGRSRKLYVTGHSLGGALATIAAARLVFVDDLNVAALYTIGSPRYGLKVFCGQRGLAGLSVTRTRAFLQQ